MRSLLLLGTSHSFQLGHPHCTKDDEAAFVSRLAQIVAEHDVAIVCEEMSEEVVVREGRNDSVPATLAVSAGISHLYCDPSPRERTALGIRDVQSIQLDAWLRHWPAEELEDRLSRAFSARECIWRDRVFSAGVWPVLFVCGANHVVSFRQMLNESGVAVTIVDHDWAPNYSLKRTDQSLRD